MVAILPSEGPRLAVVSGAARGMGNAVARRFLEGSWHVLALDRDREMLDKEASRLGAAFIPRCVEVAERDRVRQAIRRVDSDAGRLQAVITAAGIYPPTTLADYDEHTYRAIFDTNVLGTVNVAAESVEVMREHGQGGAVVTFASVDAFAVSPGQLLYGASKAAIVSLTRSLAVELAQDRIVVNSVAPGWVDTPGTRAGGRIDDALRTIPLGRVARSDEIAEWVWRLASDTSSYITGETIVLSGGSVMR